MIVGVLGLGSIGKRHHNNLVAMGHEVFVYDPDTECKNRERLLEKSNAIIIATPTIQHAQDIKDCPNNVPIFLEKPVAHKRVKIPKNVIMCGYNLRFHSCVLQAKEWMLNTMVGNPLWARFVCGQLNTKYMKTTERLIPCWSHEIDLCLYLLGAGKAMASCITEKQDLADIIISHENKCQSVVHLDYITDPEHRYFEIIGDRGAISCMLNPERVAVLNRKRPGQSDLFVTYSGKDTYDQNYRQEMEAFFQRIEGKDTFGATAEEGLAVLDVCLEAEKRAGL